MNYRDWAKEQGYPFCEVYDWTSSAGDWSFLVSKNGEEWYWMSQENNWPKIGFTRTIDTGISFFGSIDEVLEQINVNN